MSEFPIVLVKNLPYSSSTDSLYELFARFGNVHQIRISDGLSQDAPQGTCIVIFTNLASAQKAVQGANGINFQGRYLVVLMYGVDTSKLDRQQYALRADRLEKLKQEHGIQ